MTYNRFQKRNKFNATKTNYNGVQYHSKLESSYAMELDWRLKAKEIKSWTGQHKLDLRVNGIHICNYYIDFRVIYPDGSIELVEVKGFETDVWRLKWRITKAVIDEIEPGAKLILVK